MEETTKLICVGCPKGCTVEVTREGETFVKIIAGCKRGEDYAKQELTDPRRMVATTIKIKNSIHPLVPVYTAQPVPKPKIKEVLAEIRSVEVSAPLEMGAVIIEDVAGTGIDVIASREMPVA
jgi:CxxC motif-containing protein